MKTDPLPPNRKQVPYFFIALACGLLAFALFSMTTGKAQVATSRKTAPTAAIPQPIAKGDRTATFAGGCFWAMQTAFQQLKGVKSVVAGYSGGSVAQPSYEQVCLGNTGHAESIEIVFDPKVISYTELLRIFLTDIDPTTLNRQGPDAGTQYRSAIFYHDAAQKEAAQKVIQEITAKKLYANPIVTEVTAYQKFYPAEKYHQDYCDKNPLQPYCVSVVGPEVRRFQKMNRDRLQP